MRRTQTGKGMTALRVAQRIGADAFAARKGVCTVAMRRVDAVLRGESRWASFDKASYASATEPDGSARFTFSLAAFNLRRGRKNGPVCDISGLLRCSCRHCKDECLSFRHKQGALCSAALTPDSGAFLALPFFADSSAASRRHPFSCIRLLFSGKRKAQTDNSAGLLHPAGMKRPPFFNATKGGPSSVLKQPANAAAGARRVLSALDQGQNFSIDSRAPHLMSGAGNVLKELAAPREL